MDFFGRQIAFRVRRQVWADDPADLASPLHYQVEVLAENNDADQPTRLGANTKPSRPWVLAALRAGGPMQTVRQIGDRTAADGHQLKARTIQEALTDLEARGLAQGTDDGPGLSRYWTATDPTAGEGSA